MSCAVKLDDLHENEGVQLSYERTCTIFLVRSYNKPVINNNRWNKLVILTHSVYEVSFLVMRLYHVEEPLTRKRC